MDKKPGFLAAIFARLFGRHPKALPSPEKTVPDAPAGEVAGLLPESGLENTSSGLENTSSGLENTSSGLNNTSSGVIYAGSGLIDASSGEEPFVFPRTPAMEHVFRSIARNPSRYVDLLEAVRAAPPQARGEIAAAWMREHAPLAWQEARQTHAQHGHTFPPRLQSEEALLAALAGQWGAGLYALAERLSHSSPAYQKAVEQMASLRE
jgi:hypothetical protein